MRLRSNGANSLRLSTTKNLRREIAMALFRIKVEAVVFRGGDVSIDGVTFPPEKLHEIKELYPKGQFEMRWSGACWMVTEKMVESARRRVEI